jgi:RNA polymerase sigma factor (sigma-70 family)
MVEAVVRYAFAATKGATRAEIADVMQETFLRAFEDRARRAYDDQRDYGPYVASIARNLLADWARKRGRELSLDPWDAEAATVPADAPLWADEPTMRIVERYLATLEPDARALHEARFVRGLSQERAAGLLGCTRQQLRTREARLREGLRDALRQGRAGA